MDKDKDKSLSLKEINKQRAEFNNSAWSESTREGLGYRPLPMLEKIPQSTDRNPIAYVVLYKELGEPRRSQIFDSLELANYAKEQIMLRLRNEDARVYRTRDRRYDGT